MPKFPLDAAVREHLRFRAHGAMAALAGHPLTRQSLEDLATNILREEGLVDAYQSWLMVILANRYWQPKLASIPYGRRLLLLADSAELDPRVRNSGQETCGATGMQSGLSCLAARWQELAHQLGYQVLATGHIEEVGQFVRAKNIEAVVGIADLAGLEKSIDQVLGWGLPCMAEPLLRQPNNGLSLDEVWVERMIELPYDPTLATEDHYGYLVQAARELFTPENLAVLMPTADYRREVPRSGGVATLDGLPAEAWPASANGFDNGPSCCQTAPAELPNLVGGLDSNQKVALDPLDGTAAIAYDFLTRGGKYSRPFITLAVYDALTGESASKSNGRDTIHRWNRGIKRTAMSIEVFHKASLIHDDIEDHDDFRYGELAIHKRYGIPVAINVGDFLVGMGYRLVSGCAAELGGPTVADILDCLAEAHQRLSEGQGAELLWRDSPDKSLTPQQALQIYALKTAPAFEVAFYSGLRLAGPVGPLRPIMQEFCYCVGVAFQILNDLKDWCEDSTNKVAAGGDVLGGRPTLLWALALQQASAAQRTELLHWMRGQNSPAGDSAADQQRIDAIRRLYQDLGVFRKAVSMVETLEQRARGLAGPRVGAPRDGNPALPPALSRLMHFLVGSVLQRTGLSTILVEAS